MGEFILYMDEYRNKRGILEKLEEQITNIVNVLRAKDGILDTIREDWKIIPPLYMGVDMLIDEDLNIWVLELQKRPATGGGWPMAEFIGPFFQHMFNLVHNRPENGAVDNRNWKKI